MLRKLPCCLLLSLLTSALCAQVGVTTPPPYGGAHTHVSGVYVTPIPNIPMSAVVDISSVQILPGGKQEMRKTLAKIARDSAGRIYNEKRLMVPVTYRGDPALLSAHIFDPQTRVSIILSPYSHLAHEVALPPLGQRPISESGFPPVPEGAKTEDLGEATMSGVSVHGMRYLIEIPAARSGTGQPLFVRDEYWYSPDLRLLIMVVHDDPRTGQQIVTITHIKQREPDAKLFEVPPGFRVVDETPSRQAQKYAAPPLE